MCCPTNASSSLSCSVTWESRVYDCTVATPSVRPSAFSGTPIQLDSSVAVPWISISPCSTSSRVRSYVRSCGSPVRRRTPSPPWPRPRRTPSHWLGSGSRVELVDVVRPADQLPVLVVQRDEEVVRVHELAHDGVHLAVELLHVLDRARELGDPEERRLHAFGARVAGGVVTSVRLRAASMRPVSFATSTLSTRGGSLRQPAVTPTRTESMPSGSSAGRSVSSYTMSRERRLGLVDLLDIAL